METALRAVLTQDGPAGDLTLLRVGEKILYRWSTPHRRVVLRLARPDVSPELLRREYAVAGLFRSAGIPVVRPVAPVRSSPVGWFSTWEWIEDRGYVSPAVGYHTFASLVSRIHRLPTPAWLLASTPLTKVPGRLEGLPEEFAAEREFLAARYDDMAAAWPVLAATDPVVCFSDVHLGNLLRHAKRGPLLIDFEAVTRAPRAWDLAPLIMGVRRFGTDPAIAGMVAHQLGLTVDDPTAQALADVKEFTAVTWLGQLVEVSPAHAAEFRKRVASLQGEPSGPWQPV